MEKTVNTPKEKGFKVETFTFIYNRENGFFDFELKGSINLDAIFNAVATIGATASSIFQASQNPKPNRQEVKRIKVEEKDVEQYMEEAFLNGTKVKKLYEDYRNIHFPDTPDSMKTYEEFFNEHQLFGDLFEWLKMREAEKEVKETN